MEVLKESDHKMPTYDMPISSDVTVAFLSMFPRNDTQLGANILYESWNGSTVQESSRLISNIIFGFWRNTNKVAWFRSPNLLFILHQEHATSSAYRVFILNGYQPEDAYEL